MKNTTEINAGKNEVRFKSQGVSLAGLIFTPSNFDASKKYPTVVFSGPFNQVKEQMGALYGQKFADKGYIFLSFDHLGYGDSEGDVRNYENPFTKIESIRDSISYIRTLACVDREKLYGYGACASGGYMPIVATTDKRLKAIATVSGMMNNQASYFGVMTKEQLNAMFNMANEARQKAYESGEVDYYDALNMNAVDPNKLPEGAYGEGYDYYMTERAGTQTYPNYTHMAPAFLMEQAPLANATAYAPNLNTPYLGIYGEKAMADTAPLTTMFYDACSEPKELFEIPDASHVSLYDIDKDVDRAVEKMVEFFGKY
ncbi:alpha/beta hydrolase [Sediminitomix flava]|uniref:Xaa-Pro dipeptidyl-peptidase-like domain-containing protein n=1 Tax=Sediminitomix flava TaxID=379075 RepID=A0A315Z8I8_SEDFL|nr:alpha/beta hydrolase [Sediminitomix flava]PWJ40010.1 hypothetical protein BC781_10573 [Sediminitomix flava]